VKRQAVARLRHAKGLLQGGTRCEAGMKPVVLGAARDGSALFRLEVIGKLAEALKWSLPSC
jgi:hypothetical protein